jgi:hypothetical protein
LPPLGDHLGRAETCLTNVCAAPVELRGPVEEQYSHAAQPTREETKMWFGRIALGIAFASLVTSASAQDRRPEYGPSITLEAAKKIAAGTLAECQKNSWNVAVAIVDTHGFLVYFERMENTQYASMDIAIGKERPPQPTGVPRGFSPT